MIGEKEPHATKSKGVFEESSMVRLSLLSGKR